MIFRPRQLPGQRQGVILLVVISLLTLFAVVGLAFVYYSQTSADSAKGYRESVTATVAQGPIVPPDQLLDEFLRQLIYDVSDYDAANSYAGVASALRGHSLARGMYGWNPSVLNAEAFNGPGRLHSQGPFGDDYNAPNYMWFDNEPVRDPEHSGTRQGPTQQPQANTWVGGFNASYTYPDYNNMFLAAVSFNGTANGTVLMPSFWRPGQGFNSLTAGNVWTSAALRHNVMRPRIAENPQFANPTDAGGDVKNLTWATGFNGGNNDSIWLDIGSPVRVMVDGRKYKPLFAPLIVDLDNHLNVNIHGNIRGQGNTHVSNEGWGPWDVNPKYVLTQQSEWTNLFTGNGTLQGRYGADKQPSAASTMAAAGVAPHLYGQVDFDSCNELSNFGPSLPIQLLPAPAATGETWFGIWPTYGSSSTQAPTSPPVYGQAGGYGNGSNAERTNHPMLYNLCQPGGDDLAFDASNLRGLLRDGTTTAEVLASPLGKLLPLNLATPKARWLVTTHSWDVDRPGVTPWIWDPNQGQYTIAAGALVPTGPAMAFQGAPRPANPPTGSEFSPQGQAHYSSDPSPQAGYVALPRINLNDLTNYLVAYPKPDATGKISDTQGFAKAQAARQLMAKDIFTRLRYVTGAATLPTTVAVGNPQHDALRWLAQLAANIVDYMDDDDYMTPFCWTGNQQDKNAWVFGTEPSRAVINEVYVEYANDPADPGITPPPKAPKKPKATKPYQVNFWVELQNPFQQDATLTDNGAARLQVGTGNTAYGAFELAIAKSPNNNVRTASNFLGDPDTGNILNVVSSYTPAAAPAAQPTLTGDELNKVAPANGAFSGPDGGNQGFYVLGPAPDFPQSTGATPAPPKATLRVKSQTIKGVLNSMTYTLTTPPATTSLTTLPKYALFLRRLACPGMPFNNTPGANYNPYITVDYVDGVTANDGVQYDSKGTNATETAIASRESYGRKEPYNAPSLVTTPQKPTGVTKQPQHTFFRQNSVEGAAPVKAGTQNQTLTVPFHWLTHLDRQLNSPMELLEVSGFKPHELTQVFVNATGTAQGHIAPWLDQDITTASNPPQSHRLYRAFEFLRTADRSAGINDQVVQRRRLPGKINLNTMWDPEILQALCDPQNGNSNTFNATGVYTTMTGTNLFTTLLKQRTPTKNAQGLYAPGLSDQPFWGLAAPICPSSDTQFPSFGINNTILRSATGGTGATQRLFQPTPPSGTFASEHPYLQNQLLAKIFNNVTTRSNVFAVWVTVGFFEVTDDTKHPVQLGQELGINTGTNVRHRMFAIVDRSALTLNPTGTTAYAFKTAAKAGTSITASGSYTVTPQAMSWTDSVTKLTNWIEAGTVLAVDTGANQETVLVTAVNPPLNLSTNPATPPLPTSFTATFNKPHTTASFAIYVPKLGNPGPVSTWTTPQVPQFSARDNSAVIPYFTVID